MEVIVLADGYDDRWWMLVANVHIEMGNAGLMFGVIIEADSFIAASILI